MIRASAAIVMIAALLCLSRSPAARGAATGREELSRGDLARLLQQQVSKTGYSPSEAAALRSRGQSEQASRLQEQHLKMEREAREKLDNRAVGPSTAPKSTATSGQPRRWQDRQHARPPRLGPNPYYGTMAPSRVNGGILIRQ